MIEGRFMRKDQLMDITTKTKAYTISIIISTYIYLEKQTYLNH